MLPVRSGLELSPLWWPTLGPPVLINLAPPRSEAVLLLSLSDLVSSLLDSLLGESPGLAPEAGYATYAL